MSAATPDDPLNRLHRELGGRRAEYDDLRYDWFGGDAVDEFDEIVLRAGSNQAWTHHNNFEGDNRSRGQYIRDQWVNDTYRAMGHPAPHTDYAHVYVNGIYWGLYNPKERPKSDFMASYFGGDEHQYDVLNAGSLLDGNTDAWRELLDRAATGDHVPRLVHERAPVLPGALGEHGDAVGVGDVAVDRHGEKQRGLHHVLLGAR